MTERCCECGRFVSFDPLKDPNLITLTPYGSTTDLDPPDPWWICGDCWRHMLPEQKRIRQASYYYWRPAERVHPMENLI